MRGKTFVELEDATWPWQHCCSLQNTDKKNETKGVHNKVLMLAGCPPGWHFREGSQDRAGGQLAIQACLVPGLDGLDGRDWGKAPVVLIDVSWLLQYVAGHWSPRAKSLIETLGEGRGKRLCDWVCLYCLHVTLYVIHIFPQHYSWSFPNISLMFLIMCPVNVAVSDPPLPFWKPGVYGERRQPASWYFSFSAESSQKSVVRTTAGDALCGYPLHTRYHSVGCNK